MNPHQVTVDFEEALCRYTGARYAVVVNSCTMALLLAVAWHLREIGWHVVGDPRCNIEIPKRTYCSVPMSILHAGGRPIFRDEDWKGWYQLRPLPVWDSARFFSSGMYRGESLGEAMGSMRGQMLCVSFHASKTLGIEQGGAILHDDPEADRWLRMARFDGREQGVAPAEQEAWPVVGWHCYLNPSTAAQGLLKLHSLRAHNEPLPNDNYPDLSQIPLFQ